jgi:hypothetical protein
MKQGGCRLDADDFIHILMMLAEQVVFNQKSIDQTVL